MDYVRRFLIPKIPEKYLKLPKKEILMAYVSNIFVLEIPKITRK
jgi:hypothetical protein